MDAQGFPVTPKAQLQSKKNVTLDRQIDDINNDNEGAWVPSSKVTCGSLVKVKADLAS